MDKPCDGKTRVSPYVGPRPFERKDRERFFGRTSEVRSLLSLLIANRVILLYAQSGTGKTSLLNAALIPELEGHGFQVLPPARVRGIQSTEADLENENIYSLNVLASWSRQSTAVLEGKCRTVLGFLAACPRKTDQDNFRTLRIAFIDQFEELFTSYPELWEQRKPFLVELRVALEADPWLRLVLVMREEFIAQLDPYERVFQGGIRTRFRLERLRHDAALEAVVTPVRSTNVSYENGVAEALVRDLAKVRVRMNSGQTVEVEGEYVEPVQLQVVCQGLWLKLPPNTHSITSSHLEAFGNVDEALFRFYESALRSVDQRVRGTSERALRRWFEHSLITAASTRGMIHRGDTQTAGIPNRAVEELENMHIVRAEFRAGSRWYELTHDRFIAPILQNNREWRKRSYQALNGFFVMVVLVATIDAFVILAFAWIGKHWISYVAVGSAFFGLASILILLSRRLPPKNELMEVLGAPVALFRDLLSGFFHSVLSRFFPPSRSS